jgi:hypothetical protein
MSRSTPLADLARLVKDVFTRYIEPSPYRNSPPNLTETVNELSGHNDRGEDLTETARTHLANCFVEHVGFVMS